VVFIEFSFTEKFNDRMLEPDLEENGLAEVYQEAWDLFSLYFSTNSPDCVTFPSEIVNDLQAGKVLNFVGFNCKT
jgi:hypothetical protein